MIRRSAAALAIAVLAGTAGGRSAGAPAAGRSPSLLLITLDTTRADRLGCYGYDRGETPRLDRLASEGAVLEAAAAVAPLTLPAHASILTGLYPPRHGVRDNGDFRLPDRETTLAEHLGSRGYATIAVVGSAVLSSSQGLAQGFRTYDEPRAAPASAARAAAGVLYAAEAERTASEVTDAALAALDRAPSGPFFLWVHYFDPHVEYRPPPPWSHRFAGRPYDGEIAFMDAEIGRLLDGMAGRGRLRETLVVAVGDHGEALGDHGERTHGLLVYDATIRVPLILRFPDRVRAPVRWREPVSQVDLAPTILDLLGMPPMRRAQGRSFAAALTGSRSAPAPAPAYSESLYGERSYGWAALRSLREGSLEFVDAPEPEIYDLRADPGETRNLASARAGDVAAFREKLAALLAGMGEADPSARQPVSDERRRMLESLGYVAGGAPPATGDGPLPDSKRRVALHDLFFEARSLVARGRNDEAREKLERLLAEDPRNPLALSSLGALLVEEGDVPGGLRRLQAAAQAAPGVYEIQRNAAAQLRNAGRLEESARAYRAAIAIRPSAADAHYGLGKALYALRDPQAAIREYAEAIRLGYDEPPAWAALGLARIAGGDAAGAERDLARAAGADPRILAEAWKQLGWLRAREGKLAEARQALDRALAVAPGDAAALLDHASMCAKLGDREAAVGSLERLVAGQPDHPSARVRLAEVRLASGDRAGAAEALREFLAQPGADPKLVPAAREMLEGLGAAK